MLRTKRGRCEAPGLRPQGITPHLTSQTLLSLRLWVSNAQWLAHMLNSLVRVSRRVGGAANLLTTRCRPCQTWTHAIHDCSFTRRLQSPEHRARTQGTNFTRACGLMPTVRRVKHRRSAAANGTNSNAEALQHSTTTAEPTTT